MTLSQKRARASFQTRLLLHLANRRRGRATDAFTLVELMIVVAILGILAAVALPNYLQARGAAAIGSRVSEAVSFGKACAVYAATEIGDPPSQAVGTGSGADPGSNGVATTCDANGGTVTATWGNARAKGVKCLAQTSLLTSATATITIGTGSGDQITCSYGG